MPYTAPATVVTATTITTAWGNSVKAAADFLANPPACRVYNNANQNLADNTAVTLAFNSERYDTNSMHDNVTNNSRITINTAGIYLVTLHVRVDAAADFLTVEAGIFKNGATPIAIQKLAYNANDQVPVLSVATAYKLAVADYLTAVVTQNNTANTVEVATTGADYSPEFSATWIGLG